MYTIVSAHNGNNNSLKNTLSVNPENITEIKLTNFTGDYRSTTDSEKINRMIDHLSQAQYKRMLNDQTAYMPDRTRIIYLFEGDKVDFIIPYGKEAMITRKVYQVKDGQIDPEFLSDFYQEIK